MEFDETDYVLGTWFAEKRGYGNYMMTVKRTKDGTWKGEYRFRYYVDDKVFGSKDRKSVYEITIDKKTKEEDIVKKMNMLFEAIKVHYTDIHEYIEVKGNVDKFMFLLGMRDWAQIKQLSAKEVEEEYGIKPKGNIQEAQDRQDK